MIDGVMSEFDPLKERIESMVVHIDGLVQNIDSIITPGFRDDIQTTLTELRGTVTNFNKTSSKINSFLDTNTSKLDNTLSNFDRTASNFAKVSDTLAQAEFGKMVKEFEQSIVQVNGIMSKINNGEGSLGKLLKDDALYNNLEGTTRQAEQLLQDMKLNPKRYVHFSLFGKKNKDYNKPENKDQ